MFKLDKFIKFIIVGSISTMINYLTFYIIYSSGMYYLLSSLIGCITGITTNYYLNMKFSFHVRKKDRIFLSKYLSIYMISLCMHIVFLKAYIDIFKINIFVSNFLSLVITTIFNFSLVRIIVRKNQLKYGK